MDEITLKALKGSIKKWEGHIASPDGAILGPRNCPLCGLFRVVGDREISCDGCPVAEATGEFGCRGTPYSRFALGGRSSTDAQAMLDFLKNLLPAEEKTK